MKMMVNAAIIGFIASVMVFITFSMFLKPEWVMMVPLFLVPIIVMPMVANDDNKCNAKNWNITIPGLNCVIVSVIIFLIIEHPSMNIITKMALLASFPLIEMFFFRITDEDTDLSRLKIGIISLAQIGLTVATCLGWLWMISHVHITISYCIYLIAFVCTAYALRYKYVPNLVRIWVTFWKTPQKRAVLFISGDRKHAVMFVCLEEVDE